MEKTEFDSMYENEGYRCPYCRALHYCDDWGYDYEGEVMDCEECEKKFMATAVRTIDFVSKPNCEINGEEHKYEFNRVYKEYNSYFCSVCNKCELVKIKEDSAR